ncbi:TPA: PTS sugar transporter subunit IIA [Staphylococcus argenteus]|uniref:PTS sugar transporter subunit IIA n=1 Tax=Staphylococcus argenteus TaxID=985002 RepID=UPI000233FFCB|nr:PTS sugar transporter subunit IIA [Staphylococcus argenteus]MBE2132377.1 PTS sugar transporter subunit IIA [Staphylococcus argenteus]PNY95155.1 PTS ascorbate transporter subunit IIA [Staphylococcus argenteus]CCE58158.1 putative PTS transport system IIA component [Staphylococcus argenteus]SUJ03236.1 phosphoenolpyruvate-dependent sugar phosphotransferase system, EIIA 2 family protein [Staphylococcus argenteus]HDY9430390.1 PTS sugar transporter subunit IIA [Staphylococcus argenteus]
MALDILSTKRIIVKEQVNNWNEAITIASQPLLQEQVIEQGYVEAMIESVNELGPYIVIAPEIAIAHARPNNNVHQVGLSLLKLNQHVAFCDEDHYASLIFVLSAIDNHSHLSILQNLATILGDNQIVQQLLNAKNVQEITTILKEHD